MYEKMVKSKDLIITILIYEMKVLIKKIKENAFKKNVVFYDKYVHGKKICENKGWKLKLLLGTL